MKTLLKVAFIPFIITRVLLLVVGLMAPQFLPVSGEADTAFSQQGWRFSHYRMVDMWARWDSGWYLDIAKDGYRMGHDVYSMSNLAFYPTYPYLIRGMVMFFPDSLVTDELYILVGVIASNIFLLFSLVLLHQLTLKLFKNPQIAQNAVWLLLLFPTSFFLSSFYTESMFLCLSLLSFWLASKNKWALACVTAAVVTATRPVGIMIAAPLLLMYLHHKNWRIKNIDVSGLWLLIIPSGMALFFWYLYSITGDFLAAVKVQTAWGKRTTDPFQSLLSPSGYWPHITPFDQVAVITALATGFMLIQQKKKIFFPLGVYALLLTIPLLFTSTLDSASRFLLVIFPLFQYWAAVLQRSKKIMVLVMLGFLVLQLYYFALFSQFYWVG